MTESHIPYLLTWVRTYRRSGRKGRMVVQVSRVGIVYACFFNFDDATTWCESH